MILSTREFPDLYDCIKEEYQKSEEKKLLIFVSKTEVDSLCALRILVGLLNAEGIHYSVFPVTNYEEVTAIATRELEGSGELKNVIMINCGASEDVMGILGTDNDWADLCRITIIDSRRPIFHKHNRQRSDDTIMVVLDDQDPFPRDIVPDADDEFDPVPEDEEGYEDEEDEDEGVERPSRRRRLNLDDLEPQGRRQIQEERLKRGRVLEAYYHNFGYGTPSSLVMLELAHKLNFKTTLDVWCAVLGLTEHLMYMRASKEAYNHWRSTLAGYVEVTGTYQRSEEHVVDGDTTVKKPQGSAKVKMTEDFWLPMLRHWTVNDALMYSPYVGSKLETYRDSGLDRLRLLLVTMGISEKDSKKMWVGFAPKHKRTFKAKLVENAGENNLSVQDMSFDSFQILFGHDLQLTAADAVYAATAVLACAEDHKQFWHAYESLDVERGGSRLHKGLETAKFLQKRIIMDSGMAIMRNQLETNKNLFSYLNLAEIDTAHHKLFAHPIPLFQVAMFVQQWVLQKKKVVQPVVVVSPPMRRADQQGEEVCVVVGLGERPKVPGQAVVNPFGHLFNAAYDKIERKDFAVKFGFDATAIEVMKGDVEQFHEELKYTMLAAREAS